MSDKKHIDRVFQEKLKDFEMTPKPQVWENIQNSLGHQEIQRKKRFPIWARYASVAALLLLLLTIGNMVFNSKDSVSTNKITDTENTTTPISSSEDNSTTRTTRNENEILNTDKDNISIQKDLLSNEVKDDLKDSKLVDTDNPDRINQESQQHLKETNTSSKDVLKLSTSNAVVNTDNVNSTNQPTNSTSSTVREKNNIVIPNNTKSVEVVKNSNSTTNSFNEEPSNKATNNTSPKLNKATDPNNYSSTSRLVTNDNSSISNPSTKGNSSSIDKPEFSIEQVNDVLDDIIKNTGVVIIDTPTLKNIPLENEFGSDLLSIEDAIAQQAEILIEEEKDVNRWHVNANIAPVYYNSLGKGSHIDNQFVNNSKNGEINTSYGIKVGYDISNKLTVRTGVNSLNLSYDTNNVILYESVGNSESTNPLRNITFAPQSGGSSISILSAENVGFQQISGVFGDNANAAISQRISYYEVPIELEYALVNKKFGVNVIAGFSTFILDGNEVFSEFDNRNTYIGEANNINSLSFSTNLGLGINYKFSKKLRFNLEPTFKYQLNAFKQTSGNFRPYIIGAYTGFSYKF